MVYWLLGIAIISSCYFAFRYIILKNGVEKVVKEVLDVQQAMEENHFVHLPLPNQQLEKITSSLNQMLLQIRQEQRSFVHREQTLKSQIENISHDLRTPLTVIMGYLKILKKKENTSAEVGKVLAIIERKTVSMELLVNQFYEFVRIEGTDYPITMDYIDAGRILRETLVDNYPLFNQSTLTITAEIPDSEVLVVGDEKVVERIFYNIFQNASRYAEKFFKITIIKTEQAVIFCFENGTSTLTESEVAQCFDRFYQQNQERNQAGTGLGLTIAKQLAEKIGGSLTAELVEQSKADEQSLNTVRFSLKISC